MADKDKLGDTTQFLIRMDGQLLGWNDPAVRLREALDYDHFRLYGQAIIVLAAGGAPMAEVLVRLREEEARMLPPGDFLPAFEHYGMMAELDRWVLRHALRALGEGGRGRKLCINISAQTIEEPGFAPFAAMQLRLAGLEPAALVFEIDENDALDRPAAATRFAAEMKQIGCQILLDGFARRAVTFDPLKALAVNYVKVDGAVIRNILRSDVAAAKLQAILRVAEAAGIGVIAECVEDGAILAALKALKVGYAQGFGVHEPEPIDALFKS